MGRKREEAHLGPGALCSRGLCKRPVFNPVAMAVLVSRRLPEWPVPRRRLSSLRITCGASGQKSSLPRLVPGDETSTAVATGLNTGRLQSPREHNAPSLPGPRCASLFLPAHSSPCSRSISVRDINARRCYLARGHA